MESIYYVMSWLCHRTCRHCYEDRFRPYHGAELERVTAEARANFPRVIAHLPERHTWQRHGAAGERRGRVVLAGGEILLDAVREAVLYPAIELLERRYREQGGVLVVVQTTGDVLTERIVSELLERGVWMISVSGMDSFHDGFERPGAIERLEAKLSRWFRRHGMRLFPEGGDHAGEADDSGPWYQFFGAQPGTWIGSLWPRGRALANGLSTATLQENFCARWSGGLGFLDTEWEGSEVSIDPAGDVFPCCLKTKQPLGNVAERPLLEILNELRGNPVYEAIHRGRPQEMGLAHGWSEAEFTRRSRMIRPDGSVYENLCLGCDRFHDEVLSPVYAKARSAT
jgi:hypothetical protein